MTLCAFLKVIALTIPVFSGSAQADIFLVGSLDYRDEQGNLTALPGNNDLMVVEGTRIEVSNLLTQRVKQRRFASENFFRTDIGGVRPFTFRFPLNPVLTSEKGYEFELRAKFQADRLFGSSDLIRIRLSLNDIMSPEPVVYNAEISVDRYEAPREVAAATRRIMQSSAADQQLMINAIDKMIKVALVVPNQENYDVIAVGVQELLKHGGQLPARHVEGILALPSSIEFRLMPLASQLLTLHYLAGAFLYAERIDEETVTGSTHREIAQVLSMEAIGIVDRDNEQLADLGVSANAYVRLSEVMCTNLVYSLECFEARRRLFKSPVKLNSRQIGEFLDNYLPVLYQASNPAGNEQEFIDGIVGNPDLFVEWCAIAEKTGTELGWRQRVQRERAVSDVIAKLKEPCRLREGS